MLPIKKLQGAAIAEAEKIAALPFISATERQAITSVKAFVGTELLADVVGGVAAQWAASRIVALVRKHADKDGTAAQSAVDDALAEALLEQGAAVGLGKALHAKMTEWEHHRAALQRDPRIGNLPETLALIRAREEFFAQAQALADSPSPDPKSGGALQARHLELVEREQKLLRESGPHETGRSSGESPDGRVVAPAPTGTPAIAHAGAPEPRQQAETILERNKQGVTSSKAELNKLGLSQDEMVDVLTAAYRASGRNIGGTQVEPDGSILLLSRRAGDNQPVVVVSSAGTYEIATADIGVDMTAPVPTIRASNLRRNP
jgi:hypothetical protein